MKVVKVKGGNDIEPLGSCICEVQLSTVGIANPECVCMCDHQVGDEEIKMEEKYVLVP
ncbi:MAG: hypothetical protein J7L72_07730 [Candidatus Aminicenantes bacterium]|nr:hypothetical protein [Candidatus Aminicenantes bacterium]